MAVKLEYQIVGRYMDGSEVVGYHLHCLSNGKSARYTREQVAFLVGRNQVTNCTGQIYQDKLLLRGVGMSLDSLPVQQVQQQDGSLTRAEGLGRIKRGTSAANAMTQLMVCKAIVNGRYTVGYVVKNAGGGMANISRDKMIELAKAGRIGNVRYQDNNGKPILRGIDINLNELPTIQASEIQGKQ